MRSFYLNKNLFLLVFCFVVVLCNFDPFADKDLFSINWAGPRESNLLVGGNQLASRWLSDQLAHKLTRTYM